MAERAPPVSVVMITKDRPERAAATVDRLLALPDRPQVVVVDQGTRAVRLDDGQRRVAPSCSARAATSAPPAGTWG